jgi:hypothetical protein
VEVQLKLISSVSKVTSAFIYKAAGMQVAMMKDVKAVTLIAVTPGRKFGTAMEIPANPTRDKSVVINLSDSFTNGQVVRLEQVQQFAEGKP